MSLQSRFIRKEARTGSYIHTYIDLGKVSSDSVAVYEKIDSMLGLYAWKISHLCSLGICVAGFCHCCCVDLCHCQRNCQPLAGSYVYSFIRLCHFTYCVHLYNTGLWHCSEVIRWHTWHHSTGMGQQYWRYNII